MGTQPSKEEGHDDPFESQLEDWPWVWAIRDASHLDWKLDCESDEEMQTQARKQNEMPVKIAENLFLGNAASVSNIPKLKKLGVTAVLNMAGPMALKSTVIKKYKEQGITYYRITAHDEIGYPMLRNHWEEAQRFISKSIEGTGKCVVHCVAGMNRSVVIVAAHYMLSTKTPVLETVKHIRTQRGNIALQNEGFQAQLVAMARKHDLLGAQPGTDESLVKATPPICENDWRTSLVLPKDVPANALDKLTF